MVAKCANPRCNREFRELSKGRLFLLPPTDESPVAWRVQRLIDHCHWLCPNCASTHTITLEGNRPVVRKQRGDLGEVPVADRGSLLPAAGAKAVSGL